MPTPRRLRPAAAAAAALAAAAAAGTVAIPGATAAVRPAGVLAAAPAARVLSGTVPKLVAAATDLGATAAGLRLHLDAALDLPDQAGLDSYVDQLYTPGSLDFHRFLTPQGFGARFGAPQAAVDGVVAALRALGFQVATPAANHLMVSFDGSVAQVERAFRVHIDDFRLAGSRRFHANVDDITLPASLSGWVSGVVGVDDSVTPRAQLAASAVPAAPAPADPVATLLGPRESPRGGLLPLPHLDVPAPAWMAARTQADGTVSPVGQDGGATPCPEANVGYTAPDFATAYDFNGLYAKGIHGEGMTAALVEFDDFHDSNVAAVESCYGLGTPVTRRLVDGGTGAPPQGGEVEDMADITTLLEMLPNLKGLYVYVAPITGTAEVDLYNAFAVDMKAPVLSSSWGNCEELNSQADNRLFAAIAEEAAAQGQQIFDASGDSGAVDCRGFPVPTSGSISVEEEAGVPWITGVGGTNLPVRSVTGVGQRPEYTWNDGGAGGGGVSTFWTMPSWQAALPAAVHAPGASGVPCHAPAGMLCREVPDISADADPLFGEQTLTHLQGNTVGSPGYAMYCATSNCALVDLLGLPVPPVAMPNGTGWYPIGGTSLATPMTAAATVLWDQLARSKGLAGLGLVNPPLYRVAADPGAYARDFHDVTLDSNSDQYDSLDCPSGCNPSHLYRAATGYDLASGLGSYDAANLGDDIVAEAARTELSPDVVQVYGYLQGPATTLPVVVSSGYTGSDFNASSDSRWLRVSASGVAPGHLDWTADPTGLRAGTYTGHVRVSGAGGGSTLTVVYQVTPRAVAAVSPASLSFHEGAIDSNGKPTPPTCGSNLWNDELKYSSYISSGTATPIDPQSRATLTISNSGPAGSVLHWSAFFYSAASGWLSQDLIPDYDPSTAPQPVTTAQPPLVATEGALGAGQSYGLKLASLGDANRLGGFPQMNQGTYHGVLLLHDLADPSVELSVPATLVLGDGSGTPTVSVAPATVAVTMAAGSSKTVTLTLSDPAGDGGCGYVYSAQAPGAAWLSLPAPAYSGEVGNAGGSSAASEPLLGPSSDTGQGTGTVPLSIDTTGLAPGVYHAAVEIQSMDAEPNPTEVPVELVVPGAVVGPTLPPLPGGGVPVGTGITLPNTAGGGAAGWAGGLVVLLAVGGAIARRRSRFVR
jgi:hypothetical protein